MSIYNSGCTRCALHADARTVCMPASVGTRRHVLIVGEAPGMNEDVTGAPFVGQAGTVLNAAMRLAGVTRADVTITNAVKCRPPNNRTPRDEEGVACWHYLSQEMEWVTHILALGAFATYHLTGQRGITSVRGQWYYREGRHMLPTFHPAYVLRQRTDSEISQQFRADVEEFVVTSGIGKI